jgi:uncharacterized protein YjdB
MTGWVHRSLRPGFVLLAALATANPLSAQDWRPSVLSVRVEPAETELRVGDSLMLRAVGLDAHGAQVLSGFAFSSSDPRVATVTALGLVVARAAGSTTVTARFGTGPGSRAGRARIRVVGAEMGAAADRGLAPRPGDRGGWQASIVSVRLVPDTATVPAGGRLALRLEVTDAFGVRLTAAEAAFSSSDSRVATVDHTGVVTAVASGRVVITATVGTGPGARSGRAEIRVP